jgi:hypothetical protein
LIKSFVLVDCVNQLHCHTLYSVIFAATTAARFRWGLAFGHLPCQTSPFILCMHHYKGASSYKLVIRGMIHRPGLSLRHFAAVSHTSCIFFICITIAVEYSLIIRSRNTFWWIRCFFWTVFLIMFWVNHFYFKVWKLIYELTLTRYIILHPSPHIFNSAFFIGI